MRTRPILTGIAGLTLAAALIAPHGGAAQTASSPPATPPPAAAAAPVAPAPAAPALATPAPAAPAPAAAAAAEPAKPDPLVVYFDLGSASIRPADTAVLDKASRLYSEAKPLVMIVSGATDAVGPAGLNLDLSQRRAQAVLRELVARGIPAERFQVLAKGETEPSVAAANGVEEPRNRRVEIAWR